MQPYLLRTGERVQDSSRFLLFPCVQFQLASEAFLKFLTTEVPPTHFEDSQSTVSTLTWWKNKSGAKSRFGIWSRFTSVSSPLLLFQRWRCLADFLCKCKPFPFLKEVLPHSSCYLPHFWLRCAMHADMKLQTACDFSKFFCMFFPQSYRHHWSSSQCPWLHSRQLIWQHYTPQGTLGQQHLVFEWLAP